LLGVEASPDVPQIYIETHGCQMNEADSQEVARRALAAGFTLAERPEDASILVLNTCTVRDNAEKRAYGRIGHWKAVKDADPTVKVVVTGCLAEQDRDRMQRIAPHVDGVFGTRELAALGDALGAWRAEYSDEEYTPDREIETILGGAGEGIPGAYDHLRGFVNVQRGCSYYCTFCIVPHVRGRFDHRPMSDILADVRAKTALGAREITLVGQTVNAYKEPATGADFADLLEVICALEEVERVTFVSSHPKDMTEKLGRVCATLPKMNPRFHLALQSGSNPMLRRMNRKYTIEEFLDRVGTFRSHNPAWAITTDLIVGFPGETEDDFQRTLDVCATGLFAQAYMFVYSPRRGTPAALWHEKDPVPRDVAQDRFKRLVAVEDDAVRAYHERKVGTTVRALVHGISRKDPAKLSAKTIDNVTVNFPMIEAEPDVAHPWVDVRVESASVWGVRGTCIGRAASYDGEARAVAPPILDLVALGA
jgi:tRNA-2-methylthio-N6-dimethylallyladenosine synthase